MNRPAPSSDRVALRMSNQRSRDTGIEVELRKSLFRAGLRYRIHSQIVPGTRRSVDLVFLGPRVAVFLDGCFWHSCPEHGTVPAANHDWWKEKLDGNRERDRDTDDRLTSSGWLVVRIWEHDDLAAAATEIEKVVRSRSGVRPSTRQSTSANRHGSTSMYCNAGCRCTECRAANARYQKQLIERYRSEGGRGRHGTEYRYKTGCRCELCRRAHAEADRLYRNSKLPVTRPQ